MVVPSPSPTRVRPALSQGELRAVVERYAAEVRAGRHHAGFDAEQRWHVRLHADRDVDVWLIGWTTEQGTELHDHGGSSGAFTVVEGVLDEHVWSGAVPDAGGRLLRHHRRRGEVVAFGEDYVHDVRNHRRAPAVSVHAYSPPIRLMRFFDAAAGRLVRRAQTWTDDPETPAPPADPPAPAYADVDAMLADARRVLTRLEPGAAAQAVRDGARLVDIRPEWQRRADGEIPGALVVERNHLEWRLHPASDARLPQAGAGARWIVHCTEGYTSSLAAASLVSLGLDATDLVGGIHAWREAGLPTVPGGTPVEQVVAG